MWAAKKLEYPTLCVIHISGLLVFCNSLSLVLLNEVPNRLLSMMTPNTLFTLGQVQVHCTRNTCTRRVQDSVKRELVCTGRVQVVPARVQVVPAQYNVPISANSTSVVLVGYNLF